MLVGYTSDYMIFEGFRRAEEDNCSKHLLHKPSSQTCVQFNRKITDLGNHGFPVSRLRYVQLLAERERDAVTKPESASLRIGVLNAMHVGHCRHFCLQIGKMTSEGDCVPQALSTGPRRDD